MLSQPAHIQRGKLAMDWFVKAPKKMRTPLSVSLAGGKKQLITYTRCTISGAW
jgi:hypothetical protein